LFAAADIGTTTIKAGLFDEKCELLRERSAPFLPDRKFGWEGIDPDKLAASLKSLIREVASVDGPSVGSLSLSSFAETVFPVDGGGASHHGIIWYENCTKDLFDRVMARTTTRRVREITKLDASWIYSASKILRTKEDHPEIYAGARAFLDASSYMAFMLTGELWSDLSLASRTQLLDVERACWSEEMTDLWGLDAGKLPPLRRSAGVWGSLRPAAASELGMKPGIPVIVTGQDHIACALGAGVSRYDQGMISIGTSASYYSPMPPESLTTEDFLSRESLSGGYSAFPGGTYALTGMSSGGFCIDWFIHSVLGRDYGILGEFGRGFLRTRALFFPNLRAFTDKLPPGGFTRLSDSDTGLSMLQAVMEALAFEGRYAFREIFKAKRVSGLREVVMTGGGARNTPFVRILANALGSPIIVHPLPHSSGLLGGAIAGAAACGYFRNCAEAAETLRPGTEYQPDDPDFAAYLDEKYDKHLMDYRSSPRIHPKNI
jgi:xylulokinase